MECAPCPLFYGVGGAPFLTLLGALPAKERGKMKHGPAEDCGKRTYHDNALSLLQHHCGTQTV
jgi:hypothetical protein